MTAILSPTFRVLLVDDDEDAFVLIRRLLKRVGGTRYQVDWAASYESGLEAIQRREHHVYLLDYRLGVESGLELLRKAVSLGSQIPVIILTGGADSRVDMEAAQIGAADFLLKDKLDSDLLERSIRYAIQHYATLRALQKSNERFRLLFQHSMDAILITDDTGRFVDINHATCNLLGYTREQLLQMKMSDLLATESGDNPDQLQDQSVGELFFTRPDGERRYAEFSACHFAPNLNLCILRDITERRDLEKAIQEISENEKRKLGQDLHDGLGQTLAGISFLAKVLHRKLSDKDVEEATDAANIVNLINDVLGQTRELARGLCPVSLEDNDLQTALRQLSNNLEMIFSVACRVECDPDIVIADNTTAIHLYRIAQEAATNAVRHGKATTLSISLRRSKSGAMLEITDNGEGFPVDQFRKGKGLGLRVMQHRARMVGAGFEIKSAPCSGVTVTCVLGKSIVPGGDSQAPSRKKRAAKKAVFL